MFLLILCRIYDCLLTSCFLSIKFHLPIFASIRDANNKSHLFFTMNYLTDTDPSDIPPEINRVIALRHLAHAAAALPGLNQPLIDVAKSINIESLMLMQQHGSHISVSQRK